MSVGRLSLTELLADPSDVNGALAFARLNKGLSQRVLEKEKPSKKNKSKKKKLKLTPSSVSSSKKKNNITNRPKYKKRVRSRK